MKRLYILRHSKAGQTNKQVLKDFERTLTDKGIELCGFVGAYLKSMDPAPQFVLSSAAERTIETARYSIDAAGLNVPHETSQKLYLAEPDAILNEVRALDDKYDAVAIVGHNPGIQNFALALAASGDKKTYRKMRQNFTPPSVAVYDIDVESWGLVDVKTGALVDFLDAKELKKIAS